MTADRRWTAANAVVNGGVMWLYHFTIAGNVSSILQHGLKTERDRRGKGRIWLASWCALDWARSRVAEVHGVRAEALSVVFVIQLRSEVRQYGTGVYYSVDDIPAQSIVGSEPNFSGIPEPCHYIV